MKIKKLVHFQSVFEERAIPSDIPKLLNLMYYSKSKQKLITFGEMDLTHFIRVFAKLLESNNNDSIQKEIENLKAKLTEVEESASFLNNYLGEKNDNIN